MRIICDAPGQTCNRLWTYVTSISYCIAKKKKMMIPFYDWTIEDFSLDIFTGCNCVRFGKEPSGAVLDLYTLSACDRIIGPFSSYSRWASFIGEVPLCFLENKNQQFTNDSFTKIVNFFHFENGKDIFDW